MSIESPEASVTSPSIPYLFIASGLENVDRVARSERDNSLLPMWTASHDLPDAAILAAVVRGPDAGDRHVEELFDRLSDLSLRRLRVHAERVFPTILIRSRGLLGDDRSDDCSGHGWHRLVLISLSSCRLISSPLISWRSWPPPWAWPTCPLPSPLFSPSCGRWRSSPLLSLSCAALSPRREISSPPSGE